MWKTVTLTNKEMEKKIYIYILFFTREISKCLCDYGQH